MGVSTDEPQFLDNDGLSDDDVPEEAHKTLLNAVSQLYKKQRIDAPKRREPAHEISEFNLSSNTDARVNKVHVNELLNDLKEKVTHKEINKKVKEAKKKSDTLPKPLEKNEAEKIYRAVGYENVKKKLNKWNTIVERNRLATQLTFPLQQKPLQKEAPNFLTTFQKPSELEKAMAEILNQSDVAQEERKLEDDLSKLSIEEMIERRNMIAKMKARESYRIAKAVRQNKIKSKKYHRILKKERIKQELLNFEKLQKTDPEAALEKLEQIERARAEERISLRHRNTGKWAKSKAIRAKYDTEARIQLAEQLAKSRELTKKIRVDDSSSSEGEAEEPEADDGKNSDSRKPVGPEESGNPWLNEYKRFLDGYSTFAKEDASDSQEEKKDPYIESTDGNLSYEPVSNSNCITSPSDKDLSKNCVESILSPTSDVKSFVEGTPETKMVSPVVTQSELSSKENPKASNDSSEIYNLKLTDEEANATTKIMTISPKVTVDEVPEKRCIDSNDVSSMQGTPNLKKCITEINEIETEKVSLNAKSQQLKPSMKECNKLSPKKSVRETSIEISECQNNLPQKLITKKSSSISPQKSSPLLVLDDSLAYKIDSENEATGSSKNSEIEVPEDKPQKNLETVVTNSGAWNVEEQCTIIKKKPLKRQRHKKTLNDMFDEAEEAIQNHTINLAKRIKADLKKDAGENKENPKRENYENGPPKKQVKVQGLDEALIEMHEDGISSGVNDLKELKDKLNSTATNHAKEPQIDPNKHIQVKVQKLFSEIGDIVDEGDYSEEEEEEENTQKMHLIEAFADDDIADEFSKEKKEESKKNEAESINLHLPGWGSWGGTSIPQKLKSRRRQRRLILNLPKIPRKDEKKPTVIINEDSVPKLRQQLVNELPYPFSSVKDYEASIRAPIGKNWVPEKAFKKFIAPPVRTRMGTIIEPMSDDVAIMSRRKRKKL